MVSFSLAAISRKQYADWFDQHRTALCNRSPFHHPAYLDAVAQGIQVRVVFIGVYQGNDMIGAIPGFVSRRGPFQLYGSPLRGTSTSYLGPIMLMPPNERYDMVQLIEQCRHFACREWRAQYFECTLRKSVTNSDSKLSQEWVLAYPASYYVDLSKGTASVWSGMTYTARRYIRKSERLGIQIRTLDDPEVYYQLLEETFARRGVIPSHPKQYFKILIEELTSQNLLWSWAAEYEGKIISAGLFLHDDHEMHYLSGASLSQYRKLPTSYLMHWHAIETAVQSGLSIYDMTGRGIPSIDQFKEAFGPNIIEYYSFYWAPMHVRYARNAFLFALPYLRRLQLSYKRVYKIG
jgi:hypothetical protein